MKYSHALFLNPYIESATTGAMKLFPPTGLEYVATSAKSLVDKITLLDLRYAKDLSDTSKLLDFIRGEIDIVCVGIGWNRQFKEICAVLNLMPEDIPLIVGGYTATEKVEELFKVCPKIDIVVRGEGEETIQEILKKEPLEKILGISYRENGTIINNKNRPLRDINSITAPDRSLRCNDYHLTFNGINITKATFDSVLSARGCPYNCKFCTFSLNPLGQKRSYSIRSVESVVREIEETTAKIILFSDDDFFANAKRAEQICDSIIARGIKKRFMAQARIEIARHPRLLGKIVQAGFKVLLIGIESPHDYILTQLNKGFTQDAIRQSFAVLRKFPIYYHGYFIYGNINETEEEMLYIPEFAKEIKVDSITYQKLRIEKFSPLRQIAEQTPGYHVTENGALYSDAYSHADLKKIGRRIRFSFYTPLRFLKMLGRCLFAVKFFTLNETLSLLLVAPRVIKSAITREIQKGRFLDSLKRAFIRNT